MLKRFIELNLVIIPIKEKKKVFSYKSKLLTTELPKQSRGVRQLIFLKSGEKFFPKLEFLFFPISAYN